MKHISIKSIVTGLALLSGGAHAQSSVTLYGVIDEGLRYGHNVSGQSTQIGIASSSLSYSLWGLKGTEDLGGGYKTIFTLESFFNPATGSMVTPGVLFSVQSWVGLQTPTWGTVTVGRQYDPLVDLEQQTQGDFYLSGYFTTPGDVDNADDSVLFNKAVKWASPTWGGLSIEGMYSLGGVAGATGSGQTYSAALAYNRGPLTWAAGYLHIDNGNPTLSVRGVSSADSLFISPVNAAYASAAGIDIFRTGVLYAQNSIKVGAYYGFADYKPDATSTFSRSEKYNTGSVFASWQISPFLLTQIGYTHTQSSGDSSAKYNQFSAGVDYNLSKRTDIYTLAGYTRASGQNGMGAAQAVIGSSVVESGKNSQALITVGFRHKF